MRANIDTRPTGDRKSLVVTRRASDPRGMKFPPHAMTNRRAPQSRTLHDNKERSQMRPNLQWGSTSITGAPVLLKWSHNALIFVIIFWCSPERFRSIASKPRGLLPITAADESCMLGCDSVFGDVPADVPCGNSYDIALNLIRHGKTKTLMRREMS